MASTPGKSGGPRGSSAPKAGRVNTLGLSGRDLATLLEGLDAPSEGGAGAKREFARWPFREASVSMTIFYAGALPMTISVAGRNISRGGMSVLHSAFVHSGTKVRIVLPHSRKGEVAIDGQIVSCQHRGARVHELGVRFAKPIDLREVVQPDLFAEMFTVERIKPEDLKGKVLYVAESEADQRIFRHYLRTTEVQLVPTADVQDGLAKSQESFDLILVDAGVGQHGAAGFLNVLAATGVPTPVVVVAPDASPATRQGLRGLDAAAILVKPVTQAALLGALAEFMMSQASIQSTLAADDPAGSVAVEFCAKLKEASARIDAAISNDDADECRAVCLEVQGGAPAAGFQPIAAIAKTAADAIARTGAVAGAMREVRALMAACDRAKVRTAA